MMRGAHNLRVTCPMGCLYICLCDESTSCFIRWKSSHEKGDEIFVYVVVNNEIVC